jgi:hypothetical protein
MRSVIDGGNSANKAVLRDLMMKTCRDNQILRILFYVVLPLVILSCGDTSDILRVEVIGFEDTELDYVQEVGNRPLVQVRSGYCCWGKNPWFNKTCRKSHKNQVSCEADINHCFWDCDTNTACSNATLSAESTECENNNNDCASNPCQNGGSCSDTLNGYICSCKAGYHGANCEKIIEQCSNSTCQNNSRCCEVGYSGVDCSVDINECATNNGGCENDCIDSADNSDDDIEIFYACTCNSGFKWDQNQMKCVDIDECETGEHNCDDKAACANISGFFFCSPWTCTGDEDCLSDMIPSNFQCIDQYCKPTTCVSDSDCADNAQCINGKCIAPICVSNNDCAGDQHCVNRTCISYSSCEHSWDCANISDTPICYFGEVDNDIEQGKCVACLSTDDCGNPAQKCLENTCVTPCTNSSDCDDEICHEETGKCIPCVHDSECGDIFCQQGTGTCVSCLKQTDCGECERCIENMCVPYLSCTSNNDCVGDDLYCDITIEQCEQCLEDVHCAGNEYCDTGNCMMDICSPGATACDGATLLTCLTNGSGWGNPSTCMSGLCIDDACEDMTCYDGVQNGNETAADCGGNVCTPCNNDLACLLDTDCKSKICNNGICQPICPEDAFTGPVLLDGIYYDQISRNAARRALAEELDQGAQTRTYNASVGNDVLYYTYNGGVDWNADLEYTDSDIESYKQWIDKELKIPEDYAGPIVLDMEGVWWDMIATSTSQAQMDVIIDFYIEGLEYAKSLRPNALFGYWGLPLKGHSDPEHGGPSIKRLLMAQGAIFPDTYEWNPGGNDYIRLKNHIKNTLALVEGKVPVYPQISPRWKRSKSDCLDGAECMPSNCGMHAQDEILSDQASAVLDAAWEAPDGTICKSAGLAVWDAYIYERYCYQDKDSSYDAFCASTTCDEDPDCAGNCSCADGVSCNSENFCIDLQYTSGELCHTSCNENCTGKEICINGYCNPPWWRWYDLSNSEISTVWNSLDSYHKSLYEALTQLVETYQPQVTLDTQTGI